jgi:hypothetical protein
VRVKFAIAGRGIVCPFGEINHIGIVLFADIEEFDAIGPWEVLSYWTHALPEDRYRVSTFSAAGGLVRYIQGPGRPGGLL